MGLKKRLRDLSSVPGPLLGHSLQMCFSACGPLGRFLIFGYVLVGDGGALMSF